MALIIGQVIMRMINLRIMKMKKNGDDRNYGDNWKPESDDFDINIDWDEFEEDWDEEDNH